MWSGSEWTVLSRASKKTRRHRDQKSVYDWMSVIFNSTTRDDFFSILFLWVQNCWNEMKWHSGSWKVLLGRRRWCLCNFNNQSHERRLIFIMIDESWIMGTATRSSYSFGVIYTDNNMRGYSIYGIYIVSLRVRRGRSKQFEILNRDWSIRL